MPTTRFVQVHTLTSYPAVLLNRDDQGMAKRLPYGGAERLRVSSQCLKRHWRMAEGTWALKNIGAPMAVRSREVVERRIIPSLGFVEPDVQEAIRVALAKKLFGDDNVDIKKRQALLLGEPEIEFLAAIARDAAGSGTAKTATALIDDRLARGEGKRNLVALKQAGALAHGLESALFGRMVTSDPDANTDAAIHVAHAFTVHAEESESDYFTVVDDLRGAETGEAGTAGIFDTELTSGLFYGYVVVDVPALISNLGGDAVLAGRVVQHLLHLIATVSPGAKKGGTAPYAYADLMLLEMGEAQPRSLAGAFRKPVRLEGDVLDGAFGALAAHLERFDASYGSERRAALCTAPLRLPGVDTPVSLTALASMAGDAVAAGGAP